MRQKGFAPIIILIFFILVIGLGYLISRKLNNKTNPSQPPIAASTPKKTDLLSDWKITTTNNMVTLKGPTGSYSFTFPVDWKSKNNCNGGIPNDNYICLMSPDLQQNPIPAVEKGQLVVIAPPGSSYFVAGYSQDPSKFCVEDGMAKFLSCKEMEINGQKIIKRVIASYGYIDIAFLGKDKINLTVRLEYPASSGYKDNTFDQILSTYKFEQ